MPMSLLDRFITEFDVALRSLAGGAQAHRAMPTAENTATLDAAERAHAAGLMRVNHVGEVCAQALYQSQKIVARSPETRAMLDHAAQEEMDHMAWCEERLFELGSHTSYLNPIWYAGSFGIGLLAGLAGDRWSLGFVVETEKQVENTSIAILKPCHKQISVHALSWIKCAWMKLSTGNRHGMRAASLCRNRSKMPWRSYPKL
jgi:ubiquinone biosynthesis monooxygenase Coq7